MDAELEARLRELLDKRDIEEVLMRYARGIDRRDRDLIEATFHPDAVAGVEGSGKKLADYMLRLTPDDPCYTHYMCNQLIEVEGDRAYSETYFISVWELEREGKWYTRFRGGRYIDRFERRDGKWRILHRVTVDDWDRLDEIKQRPRGLNTHAHEVGGHPGKASYEDLVYHLRDGR